MSNISLFPWRDNYSERLEAVIPTDEGLKESMQQHGLDRSIVGKIDQFIFNDNILPPGDFKKNDNFKRDASLHQQFYKEARGYPQSGLNMGEIETDYDAHREPQKLEKAVHETIAKTTTKGLTKIAILNIGNFLLRERELVLDLYKSAQLIRRSIGNLSFVMEVNEDGLGLVLENGKLASSLDLVEETTPERLSFNLWFREITKRIIFLDKKNIAPVLAKIEAMEEFSKSEDEELACQAKLFLYIVAHEEYLGRAKNLLDRVAAIFLKEVDPSNKLWPTVLKITPLFALLANVMLRRDEASILIDPIIKSWGNHVVPYHLEDRLNWLTNERIFAIIENAVTSNYFAKQQEVITILKRQFERLNSGRSSAVLDQYNLAPKQEAPPTANANATNHNNQLSIEEIIGESSESVAKKKKKKKQSAAPIANVKEEQSNHNNNASSSSSSVPAPVLAPVLLSNSQERMKALWEKGSLTYAPRVERWVRVARMNEVRGFTDRGQLTYDGIESENELRAILKLHNFAPIEKIYEDKDWRGRFTFPTDTGFGMICRLKTANGKVFKGTVYIGFDKKNPNEIIHHSFVLANRNNNTFASFMRSVNEHGVAGPGDDIFYKEQKDHQLFYDNVFCQVTGKGRTEVISMIDKDGMEISAIPHNRTLPMG